MPKKPSKKNFWLGFLIGLFAALLATALAVLFIPQLRALVGIQPAAEPAPVNAVSSATTVRNTTEPTTEQPTVETQNENLSVTSPEPYVTVASPVIVRGEARVFENTVRIRLRDEDGSILADTFTTALAQDIGLFGPFEISLTFPEPDGTSGTLEVFWESPRDGSDTDLLSIPVSFK